MWIEFSQVKCRLQSRWMTSWCEKWFFKPNVLNMEFFPIKPLINALIQINPMREPMEVVCSLGRISKPNLSLVECNKKKNFSLKSFNWSYHIYHRTIIYFQPFNSTLISLSCQFINLLQWTKTVHFHADVNTILTSTKLEIRMST